MNRLVVSAFLAFCIHGLLFWVEVPWSRPTVMVPESRVVSIKLVALAKPGEEPVPVKPKPLPKPESTPTIKPMIHPRPATQFIPHDPSSDSVTAVDEPEPAPDGMKDHTESEDAETQAATSSDAVDRAAVKASVPRYDMNPPIEYPPLARRRNYQGTVVLDVRVTMDGQAAEVKIAKSSGYGILDRKAVNTVKNWRFKPARRGNRSIETWAEVPVRFELR